MASVLLAPCSDMADLCCYWTPFDALMLVVTLASALVLAAFWSGVQSHQRASAEAASGPRAMPAATAATEWAGVRQCAAVWLVITVLIWLAAVAMSAARQRAAFVPRGRTVSPPVVAPPKA